MWQLNEVPTVVSNCGIPIRLYFWNWFRYFLFLFFNRMLNKVIDIRSDFFKRYRGLRVRTVMPTTSTYFTDATTVVFSHISKILVIQVHIINNNTNTQLKSILLIVDTSTILGACFLLLLYFI